MKSVGLVRLTTFLLGLLAMPRALPSIDFQSQMSSLQLQPTNAQLKLINPQRVLGWSDRSIVKTFGHNVPTAWPENYASGSVISQSGGTQVPPTELVAANSSAIVTVSPLIRTTSNALLYGLRVNSAALLYGDRVTSNAVNPMATTIRTNSNAFAFGNRTTSAAIAFTAASLPVPSANSIDGSVFVRYCPNNYVFHSGPWTARGWVRFNNGFTVMPSGSVLMDTLTTVSGGFDLRDTGTLILNNDLYLAHNVTLTNGGNIKGMSSMTPGAGANTIFMGGDLTLASTTYARTLHITGDWSPAGHSGDLVIDGQGHTLNIGDRSQIFVDQNVTLTLRNMTIKTGPKSLFKPAIRLASSGCKLALDNVVFDLGTDFQFKQGQIFIHDEVAVTGTSAFIYQSPRPSYITSGATWSFEQDTTFSVAPATFTDCPYTVNNTYTTNNFIVHADASSALYLNNCSLKTTFTGARLRTGMVLFDNTVAVDTQAGMDLWGPTPTTPVGFLGRVPTALAAETVSWSPDGRFLAVGSFFVNALQIFSFNGISAPTQVGGTVTTPGTAFSATWSPDGRFLAIANENTAGSLQIYSFNGNSTPQPIGAPATAGTNPWTVAWSPDGRFLAVANSDTGGGGASTVQVYRFNGNSTPTTVGNAVTPANLAYVVAWSPDGNFLAVGTKTVLQIYQFNGSSTLTPVGGTVATSTPHDVAWSPDGRFVAVANYGGTSVLVCRFTGSSLISVGSVSVTSNAPQSSQWSPDGRFLAAAGYFSVLQLCRFNGSSAPTSLGYVTPPGVNANPNGAAWSPDGRFVAVADGNESAGQNFLLIFRCNYYYTGQPPQAFTNGLLFGNKALGVAYDANVQVLSGSVATIKGMVKDDSA